MLIGAKILNAALRERNRQQRVVGRECGSAPRGEKGLQHAAPTGRAGAATLPELRGSTLDRRSPPSARILRRPVGQMPTEYRQSNVVCVGVRAASEVEKTRACCAIGARRGRYLSTVADSSPFISARSAAPTCMTRAERIAGGHMCGKNPLNPAQKFNIGYLDIIPEQRLGRPVHWKAPPRRRRQVAGKSSTLWTRNSLGLMSEAG